MAVIWDVTMSLDGYTSGPNVRAEEPMGDGGESLHRWMEGTGPDGAVDIGVFEKVNASIGGIIIGRRTFDLGLKNWGGTPWPSTPSFVMTHRPRENLTGDNGGVFAFGSLEESVRDARKAAGDKNVIVLGADVARQLMRAGHLDELWLHISPILLGGGTPMFDGGTSTLTPIEKTRVGTATHHFFRVVN
jgi:dihydrofolate reductase